MRTVILAALLLAACGGDPIDLTIPKLPEGPSHRHLRMPDSPPLRRWQYRLEVFSRVPKQIRLEARLEEPAPAGVIARIADRTNVVPREGTAWPTLVVIVPREEGAFKGSIAITSPDVPDWAVRYTFEGEVVPGALEGRHLTARSEGDLGLMRPDEEKMFSVLFKSLGAEPVTIREWIAEDPQRVRLQRLEAPVTVAAGGEVELRGAVVAPRAGGPFEARVRVLSDAENVEKGLLLRFAGHVVPDYAANPPRAVETVAYPVQETEFKVVIRAREEVPPFTVAQASGHERYFDVVSLGTAEPAREQTVKFKLKRDAPTDAARDAEWQVRLRIEPAGVDVAWPVKIRLNPPIHAHPSAIDFRTVPQGTEKEREILLAAFANRAFKVTGARSERRQVRVTVPDHAPGTAWRVLVALPRGLAAGLVDDRVVIETDDPDVPNLVIPVKAEIR